MARNVKSNLTVFGAETDIISNKNWRNVTKTRFVDLRTNHMFLRVDKNDDEIEELQKSDLDLFDFSDYDAVIISDYNKGFLSEEILEYISNKHELVFLDTKKILGPWCNNFFIIKINNQEYENTKFSITSELRKKIIRTRGHLGSDYNEKIYKVEAVEVKDTSGAGDTFISALCYKFLDSKNINQAIIFANRCATLAVQKRGVSTV